MKDEELNEKSLQDKLCHWMEDSDDMKDSVDTNNLCDFMQSLFHLIL